MEVSNVFQPLYCFLCGTQDDYLKYERDFYDVISKARSYSKCSSLQAFLHVWRPMPINIEDCKFLEPFGATSHLNFLPYVRPVVSLALAPIKAPKWAKTFCKPINAWSKAELSGIKMVW